MNTTGDGYLTSQRLREVYARCFREYAVSQQYVTVTGVLLRHTFSIRMLQRNREEIVRMLLSLPEGFRVDKGGGGSVTLLGRRGDNTIWTTDMSDMEKLLALGLASGLMSYNAPREVWGKLPGGMPYIRIEITIFGVSIN